MNPRCKPTRNSRSETAELSDAEQSERGSALGVDRRQNDLSQLLTRHPSFTTNHSTRFAAVFQRNREACDGVNIAEPNDWERQLIHPFLRYRCRPGGQTLPGQ